MQVQQIKHWNTTTRQNEQILVGYRGGLLSEDLFSVTQVKMSQTTHHNWAPLYNMTLADGWWGCFLGLSDSAFYDSS